MERAIGEVEKGKEKNAKEFNSHLDLQDKSEKRASLTAILKDVPEKCLKNISL